MEHWLIVRPYFGVSSSCALAYKLGVREGLRIQASDQDHQSWSGSNQYTISQKLCAMQHACSGRPTGSREGLGPPLEQLRAGNVSETPGFLSSFVKNSESTYPTRIFKLAPELLSIPAHRGFGQCHTHVPDTPLRPGKALSNNWSSN